MENNIANQIMKEKDIVAKMEIIYVLSNTLHFTFNKACVLKSVLVKMFMECMNLDVDQNAVVTSMLLSSCKKGENPQVTGKIKTFAIESANYLYLMRFDRKVCKLVEQINRYSDVQDRLSESDILELADQYGGMLIDRSERIGFQPDEAIVLLEYRNLKNYNNKYKELFKIFAEQVEHVDTSGVFDKTILNELVNLYRKSETTKDFIFNVSSEYINQADEILKDVRNKNLYVTYDIENPQRSMFNEEVTYKTMQNRKGD